MPERAHSAAAMIGGMTPVLGATDYVFVTVPLDSPVRHKALASIVEDEGMSLILATTDAADAGLVVENPMRRITLMVYSALDGVGLTAAVASALAEQGIPCNMVAGFHHDHAFVPAGQADQALACLNALQISVKP